MKVYAVIILLLTVTYSFAIPSVNKEKPSCVKIDECSCHLTGVEQPGVIDLHSLVSGKHEPTFVIEVKSEQTNVSYNYSYNPCMNFSDFGCPNTSICRTGDHDGYQSTDLGNLYNDGFLVDDLDKNALFAFYQSKYKDKFGFYWVSGVELICDEAEVKGKFEYVGEPSSHVYHFRLFTRCACPGKCTYLQ
ncbi:uncharacterized protein [Dysidea avara]|uniref:uncharacterized protein n=1 Tax=Dysidea avara TaxID=196820 RepID=UPI003331E39C